MKPLKLTLEGLHSFKEKQAIDFSELTATGLFGIFGATGSGKSTILDAITLALYGAVKRAASNTQGILNSQKDKMEVSFTFAIGAGGDRKTYRVERSYRRNKDRPNSVVPKGSRLIAVQSGAETVLADSQAEVNRAILEIIGLNMTDFTRSVVLPQGEFAQFLKLRDAERDQMIERIFSLGAYGSQLTEKVREERNRLAGELERMEGVLKGVGAVSPEHLARVREELGRKKEEQQLIGLEYQRVEQAHEKAAAVWKLQEDCKAAEIEQEALLQSQPSIDLQRVMLQQAEAAQRVKPYEEAHQKTAETLQVSREKFQQSNAAWESAKQAHQVSAAAKLRIDTEYGEKQPGLIAFRTRLLGLLDDEGILNEKAAQKAALLTRQKEIHSRIADVGERLQKGEDYKLTKEAERKNLETAIHALTVDAVMRENVLKGAALEEDYQRSLAETQKLQSNLQEDTLHLEQLAVKYRSVAAERGGILEAGQRIKADLERRHANKPGDLAGLNGQNESLRQLEQQIATLIRLEGEIQSDRNEALQLAAVLEQKERLAGEYRRAADASRLKIGDRETEKAELELELKRIETENYAAVLAAGLADGAPCPVCGSAHHPLLAQKHESAELALKQREWEALASQVAIQKEKLDALNKDMIITETAKEAEAVQLESLRAKIRLKESSRDILKNELPGEIRALNAAQLSEHVAQQKKDLQDLFLAIEGWEGENKALTGKLEKITAAQNMLDAELGNLKGQLTAGENNLARLGGEVANRTQAVTEKKTAYQLLQQTLQIADFREKQTRILEQDRQRDGLAEQLRVLGQQLEKAEARLLELKQEAERLSSDERELKITLANLEKEIGERQTKIAAAIGDGSVREVLAATDATMADLSGRAAAIAKQFDGSQERLNHLSAQNSADQRQADIANTDFENAAREVQLKLQENGLLNIMAYRDALRDPQEQEEIRQGIQAFEDHRKRIQSRIRDIGVKLGDEKISAADWQGIIQSKEELSGRKERIAGEIGGLEMNLRKMEEQYRDMQQYLEEKRRIVGKKDMADEIAKLLQGNAFVAYIAEEHMRYILDDASARLAALTNGRYILKMDEKKDFMICDYGNGGLTRPATSLSGGETFLVSLSLALALSSKVQLNGRNPLEFFFLDEGFGTLDPRLLDTVMDSLERLQKESFTIGIISHVPELQERIARRLLVTPAGLNGEGSRVRVDIA